MEQFTYLSHRPYLHCSWSPGLWHPSHFEAEFSAFVAVNIGTGKMRYIHPSHRLFKVTYCSKVICFHVETLTFSRILFMAFQLSLWYIIYCLLFI